ncbi:D-amino-acid transaminase [Bacillus piscicola]|uniref:D-amino-acid transaminase n=1 Tax=Bacillus piscicola TaxID=1632684 RepID=UPI001F093B37|nr:D-amino-acid transaminase [Bacillus piscicola]
MEYVWLQDEFVKRENARISFEDRGYYFGDGIYEVVRVYNGSPFLLTEHFERFQRSADELDIPLPYPLPKIKDIVTELVIKNKLENGYVYVQMTRGLQEREHLYTRDLTAILTAFTKTVEIPFDKQQNGISLLALEDIRWLRCDIKTINLLGNIMAKRKAEDNHCDEALQHRDSTVTEGSSSNAFIVQNGTLYTHPANHYILNGITRQFVLQLARKIGIPAEEKAFTLDDLALADEMFMTGTTTEILPVVSVKGSVQATFKPGPVTRELQKLFRETASR